MILPRLACGLAIIPLASAAALGLAGLGAAGIGAAYLLRQGMKQSTDWAEENRKPAPDAPADPA
ncbi:MAG: hypothetical protein ACKO54_17065 [Alphaproteobacteria bacterium]